MSASKVSTIAPRPRRGSTTSSSRVDLSFTQQCAAYNGVAWIAPRSLLAGVESEQCLYVVPNTTSLQPAGREGAGIGALEIRQVGCDYHGARCEPAPAGR